MRWCLDQRTLHSNSCTLRGRKGFKTTEMDFVSTRKFPNLEQEKKCYQFRFYRSSVRLGEWDTSTDIDCEEDECAAAPIDVPVEERISHENYNPNSKTQENDIALLRLSRKVPYTDWVKPICLPTSDRLRNLNYDGIKMDVAGWGKTENGNR